MLRDELYDAILELPVIDVHSHVHRDHMAAQDLEQVMFYHMLAYCLRSAGLAEGRLWGKKGAKSRGLPLDEWFGCWPSVKHTGFGWVLRRILEDLYEVEGPLTADRLPQIRAAFEEKVSRPDWPREVLDKAGVSRLCSSELDVKPLEEGQWDGRVRFSVEDSPICGTREFNPWRKRLVWLGRVLGRDVSSAERMQEAVTRSYDAYDWSDKCAMVAWVSSDADFRPVDESVVDALLADCLAGREPDAMGRRVLEASLIRAMCRAMQGRVGTVQLCYGIQYLTAGSGAAHPVPRAAPQFASSAGHLLGEFPDLHFNIMNGFEPDEPIWAGMCQAYGNVSLGCFWWDMYFPSVMHNALHRRLDMVPLSRLAGFLSDGWCVEYVYGRVSVARRVLANVLTEKIERGFWTRDEALKAARTILFDTPRRLFLPNEKLDT